MVLDETQKYKQSPAIRTRLYDLDAGKYDESKKNISTIYGLISKAKIVANLVVKRPKIRSKNDSDDTIIKNSDSEQNYYSFLIDDGSSCLWISTSMVTKEDFDKIRLGQLVVIIGKIKKIENSLVLYPDIFSTIEDPNFEVLNELELTEFVKKNGIKPITSNDFHSNEIDLDEKDVDSFISNENNREIHNDIQDDFDQLDFDELIDDQIEDKILNYISKNDLGDGVLAKKISQELQLKDIIINDVLKKLSLNTKIYSNKPGSYKLY